MAGALWQHCHGLGLHGCIWNRLTNLHHVPQRFLQVRRERSPSAYFQYYSTDMNRARFMYTVLCDGMSMS